MGKKSKGLYWAGKTVGFLYLDSVDYGVIIDNSLDLSIMLEFNIICDTCIDSDLNFFTICGFIKFNVDFVDYVLAFNFNMIQDGQLLSFDINLAFYFHSLFSKFLCWIKIHFKLIKAIHSHKSSQTLFSYVMFDWNV